MLVVGLTGTIASGKTTTARMLADEGVPVFSADEAVHRLYAGPLAAKIETAFPGTTAGGVVDRTRLAAALRDAPNRLRELEAIVHPAVREEEQAFLAEAARSGAEIAVLEVPLLFETGADRRVDRTIATTAPVAERRARAAERTGMSPATFDLLEQRQLSDAEKTGRADFIVDTSAGPDAARLAVRAILAKLRAGTPHTE